MNRYPTWKNVLILVLVLLGIFLALPNIYGNEPAIQISQRTGEPLDQLTLSRVEDTLDAAAVAYTASYLDNGRIIVRFADTETQIAAQGTVGSELNPGEESSDYLIAQTLSSRMPEWLRDFRLRPMSLGLDLRGGVHLLYQVDLEDAVNTSLNTYITDFRQSMQDEDIRYQSINRDGQSIRIVLKEDENLDRLRNVVRDVDSTFAMQAVTGAQLPTLRVSMSQAQIVAREDLAISQNILTLKRRVGILGVAEPIVQRSGRDRIVVQVPGVQDASRLKEILNAKATLEWRMQYEGATDAYTAKTTGRTPLDALLYDDRDGQPVLLKRELIATGQNLTSAVSTFDQTQQPIVSITLDQRGAARMLENTKKNVNKLMGVVFREDTGEYKKRDGEVVFVPRVEETVISLATIRGVFSSRFQISGLTRLEADRLARLLQAGALAAPVYVVEERTIGPTLGQENIDAGTQAIIIGFIAVVAFMVFWYKSFGMVANLALLMNVVLIVALLSSFGASLTLPGIAGIVLTVGMAVDANVLIFERIREELRNGNSPQASITAGYDKALSTIADANITTFIAAVVLFTAGTGPIKGFAITLTFGIMTSMFTAILGTRAVINWAYGGRTLERLSI